MKRLEVRRAFDLEPQAPERSWLVDELWAEQAVGVVGGEPKCCKSFLALELAVAVASGTPCLGRFATRHSGPVLLFAAEDALHVVRQRLEGICRASDVAFAALDVNVITDPVVRLDLDRDRSGLRHAVESTRPRLLILDPFVRLHRVDENVAADVAPLLAYLRELQRSYQTAVLLVHHARKASHARAGQALRGSSEIHAWGDSYLYLRRLRDRLLLSVEHRAAPAIADMDLALHTLGNTTALRIVDAPDEGAPAPRRTPRERIIDALAEAPDPMDVRSLRAACRMRTMTLCDTLNALKREGLVVETDAGYQLH